MKFALQQLDGEVYPSLENSRTQAETSTHARNSIRGLMKVFSYLNREDMNPIWFLFFHSDLPRN